MSFLDLILKQDLILISLGFVLLPLTLAFGMVIFRTIRSLITGLRIAREKRQQEIRALPQQRETRHFIDDPDRDVIEEVNFQNEQPLIEEVVEDEEEIITPAAAETTVTNAMQDILNDVFVDDGSDDRVEVLLGDADKIDVKDLVEFAQTIAQRLSNVHPAV